MKPWNLSLAGAALAFALAPAQASYTVRAFTTWGASDAALGLNPGSVIEDFEDVTLVSGLLVTSANGAGGGYGPTGTLPRTFDPRPTSLGGDDAFGSAFWSYPCGTAACSSLWDGSHALLNTSNNNSMNYATSPWSDITLSFTGGATQVGFSLHQNELDVNVYINGSLIGSLPSGGGGRNAYFRFDVTGGSAPITSILLDGNPGDAWVIDHLAFTTAVPEPSAALLWASGLLGTGLWLRRRSAR